jgi:tRNA(Ser,Leu) C12 N-acetylase TAN1
VIALEYVPALADKAFHVRMHRRGFKGRIQRTQEEQLLDRALLESLTERGMTARIDFEDPDAILAVETVGDQAGMSLWLRMDLQRYPFLRQSFGVEPASGLDESCSEN